MAIRLIDLAEEKKIIKDCVNAAKDITSLTNRAYSFLCAAIGFIAHYDKIGFMTHYEEPGSLKKDILIHQRENQHGNFYPEDENYDYYMQDKKIYNTVCDCIKNDIAYKPTQKKTKEMEFDFGR
jgi:hypothetical protein